MKKRFAPAVAAIVAVVAASVTGVLSAQVNAPASLSGAQQAGSGVTEIAPDEIETYISPSVVLRFWLANVDQAPAALRPELRRAKALAASAPRLPSRPADVPAGPGVLGDVFNLDASGSPQNEESIAVCDANPQVVLGGTNDFRKALVPPSGINGWHFSHDGGRNVANEGILPPLKVDGVTSPTLSDPVDAIDHRCNLYAGALNFDPRNPDFPTGIGVYRSSPGRLASCPGGSAPSCWPARRVVATAAPNHALDKEWLDVGRSGAAGNVVWVVYTDMEFDPQTGRVTTSLQAVRCAARLTRCTSPIRISGDDPHAHLGDVTIGPDGRVYITWSELLNVEEFDPSNPPEVIHKLRVAEPGRTTFGPERVIDREKQPILDFKLHANDFRIPPYAKNEVRMVRGRPRVFLIWEGCRTRPLGFVCEEPAIKLRHSDDLGATWTPTTFLSVGGDNYFPTIANDRAGSGLAAAWYTNRFDSRWHHRQDVELVGLDPTGAVTSRQRVTPFSNEPDADPSPFVLGNPGSFIGDYIEVAAHGGIAYVHYNMNYREEAFFGQGLPVNQQDNYLSKRRL